MLERFWVEQERERHYLSCFFLSFSFGLISIVLAYFFVPFQVEGTNIGGFVAVLMASLAASYPLMRYLEKREIKEEGMESVKESKMFYMHRSELMVYLSFFLGMMLSFFVANFAITPEFFYVHNSVISSITGQATSGGMFYQIITNNLSVYFLTFLLSFLLTAGMVFILVWNASVLGIFLSSSIERGMTLSKVVLGYMPHGTMELSAYAIAGISGFFLSHHLEYFIRGDSKGKAFELSRDSIFVFFWGLILLFAAGFLEVGMVLMAIMSISVFLAIGFIDAFTQ